MTLPSAPARLRDGSTVSIRAIRPGDREALVTLYLELSDRSRHLRFLSTWTHFEELAERAMGDEPERRLDVVATREDLLIAHAMYTRTGVGRADVAFTVLDAYQHLGLGPILLDRLANEAREHGITTFEATMLTENHDMIDVFRHSGYDSRFSVDVDVVTVELSIESHRRDAQPTPYLEAS